MPIYVLLQRVESLPIEWNREPTSAYFRDFVASLVAVRPAVRGSVPLGVAALEVVLLVVVEAMPAVWQRRKRMEPLQIAECWGEYLTDRLVRCLVVNRNGCICIRETRGNPKSSRRFTFIKVP